MTKYKDIFHTGCILKITLHPKDTAVLEGLYVYFSNYFTNISFNKYNTRTNKVVGFSTQTAPLWGALSLYVRFSLLYKNNQANR